MGIYNKMDKFNRVYREIIAQQNSKNWFDRNIGDKLGDAADSVGDFFTGLARKTGSTAKQFAEGIQNLGQGAIEKAGQNLNNIVDYSLDLIEAGVTLPVDTVRAAKALIVGEPLPQVKLVQQNLDKKKIQKALDDNPQLKKQAAGLAYTDQAKLVAAAYTVNAVNPKAIQMKVSTPPTKSIAKKMQQTGAGNGSGQGGLNVDPKEAKIKKAKNLLQTLVTNAKTYDLYTKTKRFGFKKKFIPTSVQELVRNWSQVRDQVAALKEFNAGLNAKKSFKLIDDYCKGILK